MNNARTFGPIPSLAEQLLAEQRQRWQRGERVPIEVLLAPHPALRANAEAVLHLVFNEVVLREQAGETPGLAEYRTRFPALAAELELQFALDRALQADLLTPPTVVDPAQAAPGPSPPAAAEPQSIAGFEILGELGRGGMGIVYKAWQTSLSRLVALKMLLSGVHAGPEELARFRSEAEAVARLQHPNIVQIHEVGAHDGRPYFALEYVEGGNLASQLSGTPQPIRESAALVETLARAVHYAHQRGIVHRDLKPANILLSLSRDPVGSASCALPTGSRLNEAVAKITDFGLAKLVATGNETLTHSGQILGTPDYMAPEQARGGSKHVGPAADVYALGAILYECLTGRPPFKGETLEETLLQVLTEDPVPPSRLRLKTPRDLDTVTLKCLAKEPARRYLSALDLAEDLRRFLAGEPIAARPPSRAGRLWRWGRRNPAVASLSSVLLLTLLGGLVALTALYLHARRQQGLAEARAHEVVLERDRAEENFRMARGAVEKYLTNVGESAELKGYGLEQLRRRLLGEAREFYERFVHDRADEPALLADLARAYGRLGYISAELNDTVGAIELYGRAVDLFARLAADRPDDLPCQQNRALCLHGRGSAYTLNGQWAQAEASLSEARARLEQLGDEHPDSPEYPAQVAEVCHSLSALYDYMARRDDQEQCDRAALAIYLKLAGQYPDGADYQAGAARSLGYLGRLYGKTARPTEAEESLRESLRIFEGLARDPGAGLAYPSDLARCHTDLGFFYNTMGRHPEAQAAYLAARKLLAELVRLHPYIVQYSKDAAANDLNLGISYSAAGQRENAAAAYEEARRGFAHLADENPKSPQLQLSLARACNNLGNIAFRMGQLPRAESAYAQAHKAQATLTQVYPDIPEYQSVFASTLNNLGNVYVALKRPADAEIALRESLKVSQRLVREHSGDVEQLQILANAHHNLGILYAMTEQLDQAENAYDEACRRLEQLRHDHAGQAALAVNLAVVYHNRGLLALRRDRPEDAHLWLTKALAIREEIFQKDEGNAAAREELREVHEMRAEAAGRLRRLAEAEKDWERALNLGGDEQRDAIRIRRACTLARLGDHARPAAEATEIARGKGMTGERFYDLACVYSLSSAAARRDARLAEGERAALSERYALLALEMLAKARMEGYFKESSVVEHLKKDTDLEPLRAREDFKKLLAELDKSASAAPR